MVGGGVARAVFLWGESWVLTPRVGLCFTPEHRGLSMWLRGWEVSGCQGRRVSWGHCSLSNEVGGRFPADQRDGPRGAGMWEGLGGDGGQNRGL